MPIVIVQNGNDDDADEVGAVGAKESISSVSNNLSTGPLRGPIRKVIRKNITPLTVFSFTDTGVVKREKCVDTTVVKRKKCADTTVVKRKNCSDTAVVMKRKNVQTP